MDTNRVLLLLFVAVFAVTCKPASNNPKDGSNKEIYHDDAKKSSGKLVYQTMQDEIAKLNEQVRQLKAIYQDAAAKKSIEKAMHDDEKDGHAAKGTIEKEMAKDAVKEKKGMKNDHLPSVEDSLKKAFDVKRIHESPAIKAEDIPLPAPKQPTMVGVKEGNDKKELSINDFVDDFDVADITGVDFDEFLDEGEKKDAPAAEKKSSPAADATHQGGHNSVEGKEPPEGAMENESQNGPTHNVVTGKAEKKDSKQLADEPTTKEVADFFSNAKRSDEPSKEVKTEIYNEEQLSPQDVKEMMADEENVDSDAEMDESEEVKRKEDAKRGYDNLSSQLKDVRNDIVAIGKDFGGMRNDYLTKKIPQPLSADARSKLRTLKDDFKEIISEFKDMESGLPKNADEMDDEEEDRVESSKPQYTNDEVAVLVNDMKSELREVAKKMKVVKDAVMKGDRKEKKAEEDAGKEKMAEPIAADTLKKDVEEPKKSDEDKAKMKGLRDELRDIMKEAESLRAQVFEQRKNSNQKRDQDIVDKQVQKMRDLRDELGAVRTEIKALEDEKNHV